MDELIIYSYHVISLFSLHVIHVLFNSYNCVGKKKKIRMMNHSSFHLIFFNVSLKFNNNSIRRKRWLVLSGGGWDFAGAIILIMLLVFIQTYIKLIYKFAWCFTPRYIVD